MEGIRNVLIGISIGISLTKIFGSDVIGREFVLIFLGLAGLTELLERRKKN